jgi:hypothetical protein
VNGISIIRYLTYLLSISQFIFINFVKLSFRKDLSYCSIWLFLIRMLSHINFLLIFLRNSFIIFLWLWFISIDLFLAQANFTGFLSFEQFLSRHVLFILNFKLRNHQFHITIFRLFFPFSPVCVLDKLFLLINYLKKQINVFKITDWKVSHQILSIYLCYFPYYLWLLVMDALAMKIIFGEPVLTRLTS